MYVVKKDRPGFPLSGKEQNIDIMVIRSAKNGDMVMAKPCAACLPVIQSLGIRYVYYSTQKGYIMREIASEMKTSHHCYTSRHPSTKK